MFTVDRSTARTVYLWHLGGGDRPLTDAANETAIANAAGWIAQSFIDDAAPGEWRAVVDNANASQRAYGKSFVEKMTGAFISPGHKAVPDGADAEARVAAYWIVLDAARETLRQMYPSPSSEE